MKLAFMVLALGLLGTSAQAQTVVTIIPILDKAVCTVQATFTRSCMHTISDTSASVRCTGAISAGDEHGTYVLTASAKKIQGTPPLRSNNSTFVSCSARSNDTEWYGCSIRDMVRKKTAVYNARCGFCDSKDGTRFCVDLRSTLSIKAGPSSNRAAHAQ